uniref:plectin-like isoform X2 n=1 Tax=Styela clava TaxID=7725 RepID=UPI0019397196|nr:plectin-like isoform X2 [Styela clava]
MEPGIIAAIVILSVELIIIIVVLIYLFSRKKPPATETPKDKATVEAGKFNKDESPEKKKEIPMETKVVDENEEKKEDVKKEEPSPISEKKSEPVLNKMDTSDSSSTFESSSSEESESEPEKTEHKSKPEDKPKSDSESDSDDSKSSTQVIPVVSGLVSTVPPDGENNCDKIEQDVIGPNTDPVKETKEKNVESAAPSSDEGVGDIEKRPMTSSDTSSSSSSSESETEMEVKKENESDNEKEETMQKENHSSSSSSSSSSSESDNEIIPTPDKPAPVAIIPLQREANDSSSSAMHSLENGITLSLRLDNLNDRKSSKTSLSTSSSSSDSSSSSSDEEGIKVIRKYDTMPSNGTVNGDIAVIYDPLQHKVVNMDNFRTRRYSSSSSGSDVDEIVPNHGDEVVAGIINVTKGEKLTISKAISKGLIPEKTGMLLLEAQAATGSVVNPRTTVKLSVSDAVEKGVVDAKYKATLSACEGAYYGYLDPRKNESVPLFEAMRRGIFPRAQGMRLLEAQVATGGIIDPWTGIRYPLSNALAKGLIDQSTAKVLKNPEEHADFFDPNTKQRLSYGNLLSKCIRDLNTGLKFLYLEEKPTSNFAQYQPELLTFRSAFRRKVTLQDLIAAGVVSQRTLDSFNTGDISRDDLYEKLKPYLVGDLPIAGIYNRSTHEVLSICQAVRSGLLRKSTALELLEAQAATGNILDPKTGKQLSVSRAISVGLVDSQFASSLRKAELAVLGYKSAEKNSTISLYEAMKKGLVLEIHAVRLLDAQIATGGLIDPVGGYRIPVSVAVKRGMLDQRLADALANPTPEQKGYYDPNTGENLTYAELLRRTVVDKKRYVGMRLLPLNDKAPNIRIISKGPTRSRKVIIMNPHTNKPMSLKNAVAAGVIDKETARRLQAQQGTFTT